MTPIERTADDTSSGWAATSTGRVFVSKNVDAEPGSAVIRTRIDDDVAVTPNRYVSSIFVDPEDGNHAGIPYNGFKRENTPPAAARSPVRGQFPTWRPARPPGRIGPTTGATCR